MMQMLCRNRVGDFDVWWAVFRSHADAHRKAGLRFQRLWRNADDPNEVFFLFDVEDRSRAEAFIGAPDSEKAGQESGVLEGDYYFVEQAQAL